MKNLETPDKIRTFQRKLYCKAKAEPAFRFYVLYDKICRADILAHAYELVRANDGSPGVDEVTFKQIEARGLQGWLADLREDLAAKTYRPSPVKRAMVPKPGGGERPLGIPTIRDRVAQTAAKLVLEPIFEADFEESAYGYRPRRSAVDAVQQTQRRVCRGYTDVVDADLSKSFDTIPHAELLPSVARRVVDRHVLWLLTLWLRTPVEERGRDGKVRMSGGKGVKRGTPQGGVVSPLLANIYMNRFLKDWRLTKRDKVFWAAIINYADDFVIVSCKSAAVALAWTRQVMAKLGLTLNEAKTSIKDARTESFDFLGYTLGPRIYSKTGRRYQAASPSKKSVQRLKAKIKEILHPGNKSPWPDVQTRLNQVLVGWAAYFSYGSYGSAYRAIDRFVRHRVRNFLRKRHKVPGRGTRQFPASRIHRELGVVRLQGGQAQPPTCAL